MTDITDSDINLVRFKCTELNRWLDIAKGLGTFAYIYFIITFIRITIFIIEEMDESNEVEWLEFTDYLDYFILVVIQWQLMFWEFSGLPTFRNSTWMGIVKYHVIRKQGLVKFQCTRGLLYVFISCYYLLYNEHGLVCLDFTDTGLFAKRCNPTRLKSIMMLRYATAFQLLYWCGIIHLMIGIFAHAYPENCLYPESSEEELAGINVEAVAEEQPPSYEETAREAESA